jgi:hypothetical protein
MSTLTAENIFRLIEQLPLAERRKLERLIEERPAGRPQKPDKAPLDKRLPAEPMPDRTREMAWIKEHRYEYAGQFVALDGDRLVAASPDAAEVWAAVKADGGPIPLVHRMASLEEMALWERLKSEQPAQPPRDKRQPPAPWPEAQASMNWLREHSHEYPGQWVALDGDRLIAHSPNEADVWAAAKADGANIPLIHRIASPDEPPFIGI